MERPPAAPRRRVARPGAVAGWGRTLLILAVIVGLTIAVLVTRRDYAFTAVILWALLGQLAEVPERGALLDGRLGERVVHDGAEVPGFNAASAEAFPRSGKLHLALRIYSLKLDSNLSPISGWRPALGLQLRLERLIVSELLLL